MIGNINKASTYLVVCLDEKSIQVLCVAIKVKPSRNTGIKKNTAHRSDSRKIKTVKAMKVSTSC